MPLLSRALRAAAATALVGGFALAGAAAATADPTGNPADVNTLAGSLSKGYDLNNCNPGKLDAGELAVLTCGQSSDPAGPVQARYILFSNGDNLAASFKTSIKDDVLTACGDSGQSPTTWPKGTNGANSGSVACGTYQNAAEVIWTTDSKNVLGLIRGPNADVQALYQWWLANR
ncbi:serine/threonine protein kinase [Mycobacterium alsense]|uniref:serine/threonine protein kinase n=1 Tax=Mycobacterium alsense TaxID=324058 RepID=UPI0007FDFCEE|nr:serine/threonine protein kinase [Mycobacterium alsense]OBI94586.1 serine/threonine protein kinase [Mycobacterium alsense]